MSNTYVALKQVLSEKENTFPNDPTVSLRAVSLFLDLMVTPNRLITELTLLSPGENSLPVLRVLKDKEIISPTQENMSEYIMIILNSIEGSDSRIDELHTQVLEILR